MVGEFLRLGGQLRNYIGRLNKTEPATQTLTYSGSGLTWSRGGTAPEVWRTTFELTTNRTTWTRLGDGTRTVNGWHLTNASLPANSTVRARGYTIGGFASSSSWFVESQLAVIPQIITGGRLFGMGSNHQFGFNLNTIPGLNVVVEASTNMFDWTAIQTNAPDNFGTLFFQDPQSSTHQKRFYRARFD